MLRMALDTLTRSLRTALRDWLAFERWLRGDPPTELGFINDPPDLDCTPVYILCRDDGWTFEGSYPLGHDFQVWAHAHSRHVVAVTFDGELLAPVRLP